MNPKLAPESLVYECGEVIIPPNEKVVSTASVKWTKLSRKAPYTYSPFNSYSSFNMRGKCFCNLFICRCYESRLLLQYLRLSSSSSSIGFSVTIITGNLKQLHHSSSSLILYVIFVLFNTSIS